MLGGHPEIIRCPPERVPDALSIVLHELAPSQRGDVAGLLLEATSPTDVADEPLYVAMRGDHVVAAAWGQRQSGKIAVFWPPRRIGNEDIATCYGLAEAVVKDLDRISIEMAQVLVGPADFEIVPLLEHVHFRWLSELLYLACEAARLPCEQPMLRDLVFVPYDDSQRARLRRLIERTYVGTLDCAGLDGVREVENVISGYQATGAYRPENWLIVRTGDADVGILLLADHRKAGHWELMYMGLVPEARGRGWGRQITQYAQLQAGRAGVERIVLAVDAVNEPALRMYRSVGFEIWDRRSVYVRFPGKPEPSSNR